VCTGRQVSTSAAHLQAVSCLAATQLHITSASEDSNIHVWSVPHLLSLTSTETHEPLRTLSNHRAAITSIGLGHSASSTNICVSASKDNTIIVWNYHTGDLLRTFLLQSTPLCLALDPCDRGVYIGFEDGSLQLVEFVQTDAKIHPLYDTHLQSTPVQVTSTPWIPSSSASSETESAFGAVNCIGLSYDGTTIVSGHSSGKIGQWDAGRHTFSAELVDLNAPVTNLLMQSPFPNERLTKPATVVKPKLSEGNYTFTAQLVGNLGCDTFDRTLQSPGIPAEMLEDAISRFFAPGPASATTASSSSGDEKLREENENLRKVINEQQLLLKKMQSKLKR
jgi:pre-rRNA-processing protein IPI3